jgi:hypothetical protein
MKKITLIMLLVSIGLTAQIGKQNEDRFSIQLTTDNVIFQKGIFYSGVEFQAEFSNGIYIRPQLHYAALKDGSTELSSGIGYNLAYNRWNYKSGVKLGFIKRAVMYPTFGIELGTEYHITEKIGIGIRASYNARADNVYYDGNMWICNSQMYIKFVL